MTLLEEVRDLEGAIRVVKDVRQPLAGVNDAAWNKMYRVEQYLQKQITAAIEIISTDDLLPYDGRCVDALTSAVIRAERRPQ